MGIWLSLIATFFLQEIVTTTGILAIAYQQHIPLLLIHALWFVIVLFETVVMYLLGVWIRKQCLDSSAGRWVDRKIDTFENMVGHYGKHVSLGIFAFFFSPALAAIFAAWLRVSFIRAVCIIVLADFVWYLFEWAVVLGIAKFSLRLEVTVAVAAVVGLLITIAIHVMRKRLG